MATTSIKTSKRLNGLARSIPILSWMPRYEHAWLGIGAIAGLTLRGLVVPEAMAYAGIAGLPPQAGLYTLVASLLIYALFGPSCYLVVQATSATAAPPPHNTLRQLVSPPGPRPRRQPSSERRYRRIAARIGCIR